MVNNCMNQKNFDVKCLVAHTCNMAVYKKKTTCVFLLETIRPSTTV